MLLAFVLDLPPNAKTSAISGGRGDGCLARARLMCEWMVKGGEWVGDGDRMTLHSNSAVATVKQSTASLGWSSTKPRFATRLLHVQSSRHHYVPASFAWCDGAGGSRAIFYFDAPSTTFCNIEIPCLCTKRMDPECRSSPT
jgi:hypothetical protein